MAKLDYTPLSPAGVVPLGAAELGRAPDVPAPANDDLEPLSPPEGAMPLEAHPKLGRWSRCWAYVSADGALEGYVCRFETPDGKEFRPLRYGRLNGREGWHWKGWGDGRPLYNLPALFARPWAPVLAVEGEKAADGAAEIFRDHVVVSPMNGAQSPHKTDWSHVAGRHVVIWPDHDAAGAEFGRKVARLCRDAGAASVRVVRVPRGAPEGWDPADPLPEGWTAATLATALEEAAPFEPPAVPEPSAAAAGEAVADGAEFAAILHQRAAASEREAVVAELNERYFVVSLGGTAVVASSVRDEQMGRDRLVFHKPADFRVLYLNRQLLVGVKPNGEPKSDSAANVWLKHPRRRTYDGGLALIPKGPVPANVHNLWRGFGVEPAAGDRPVLEEFLRNVIAGGNEAHYNWLLRWMAYCVQYPERQAEVAVVLRGPKGTGKGSFAKIMRAIFRAHYLHISNGRHLTGHFNAHLVDCLFLFVDEAVWAGDKQAEGTLKAIITEDTLMIEPKGVNGFAVPNRLKTLIASNADWVVPATADERRFFVLEVGSHRKGDVAYWTAVNAAIDGPELAALLQHLLTLDLSGFDHRNPPHTQGLGQQKLVGGDSVQRWWYDCLSEGAIVGTGVADWPATVVTQVMHAAYVDHAREHGERYPVTDAVMTRRLRELWPGCEAKRFRSREPYTPQHGPTVDRPQRYKLDTLAAHRAAFLTAMRIEEAGHAWPEVIDLGEGAS